MSDSSDAAKKDPDGSPPPETAACKCENQNAQSQFSILIDFCKKFIFILPTAGKVSIGLIVVLCIISLLLSAKYLYTIFHPVDDKVAVNQINKNSKDYQYVSQVQTPLSFKTFGQIFTGIGGSFTTINLKIFVLISMLVTILSFVMIGAVYQQYKQTNNLNIITILFTGMVFLYGIITLIGSIVVYNKSAVQITSRNEKNMYSEFNQFVRSCLLTTNGSFINTFTRSGDYLQRDNVIQQALATLSASSAPAPASTTDAPTDDTVSSPQSELSDFLTVVTPSGSASPADTSSSSASNAVTIAQALFTINMYILYSDSKPSDDTSGAFQLFSAANYLTPTEIPYADYLYRKFVAIPDKASIYKSNAAFSQFSVDDQAQGLIMYQKWVRQASSMYANFYPEEYYSSIKQSLIGLLVVNIGLIGGIVYGSEYLPLIANLLGLLKATQAIQ
jgi:hypothetical protein